MWKWSLFPVVLVVTSVVGCATYQAPEGADAAILRGAARNVGVTSVDNFATCGCLRPEGVPEVRLAPGKHTVHVVVMLGSWYAEGDLWFVPAPRGEYEVHYHAKDMKVALWIVDKETGQPVGGVKGSDDEPPEADDPPVKGHDSAPVSETVT